MNITLEEVQALATAGVFEGLQPLYTADVREMEDGSTVNDDHGNLTFGEGAPSNAVQKTTAALMKLRAGMLEVPAPPAAPIITYKADVIRRCTDDEADALKSALDGASSKLYLLWNGIQRIEHGDADFPLLRGAIVDTLRGMGLNDTGANARADELLAASPAAV